MKFLLNRIQRFWSHSESIGVFALRRPPLVNSICIWVPRFDDAGICPKASSGGIMLFAWRIETAAGARQRERWSSERRYVVHPCSPWRWAGSSRTRKALKPANGHCDVADADRFRRGSQRMCSPWIISSGRSPQPRTRIISFL